MKGKVILLDFSVLLLASELKKGGGGENLEQPKSSSMLRSNKIEVHKNWNAWNALSPPLYVISELL